MSVSDMEAYESEYATPEYTIVDRKIIGRKVITAVIIGGEFAEFEKDITDEAVVSN